MLRGIAHGGAPPPVQSPPTPSCVRACACARARVRVCVCAYACARMRVRVCACVRACVRIMRARARVRVRAHYACAYACARVCSEQSVHRRARDPIQINGVVTVIVTSKIF